MKIISGTVSVLCVILLQAISGCQRSQSVSQVPSESEGVMAFDSYSPAKIQLLPLTEFVVDKESEEVKIKVYLSLLDSFGSQQKAPGVFRFELYPHISRSNEQKGRRIKIWPDIDLTNAEENNKYWKDFLRAYKFSLDFESIPNQTCILQVTCLSPNGKRLSNKYTLKLAK